MPIGFTLPFSKSSGSIGFFETTSSPLAAVQENLKALLLTNKGERVNHYNMGCNLKEFLFENNSPDELRAKIAVRILSQIELWMPFVGIKSLLILTSEDDESVTENTIKIKITFYLSSAPDTSSKFDLLVSQ